VKAHPAFLYNPAPETDIGKPDTAVIPTRRTAAKVGISQNKVNIPHRSPWRRIFTTKQDRSVSRRRKHGLMPCDQAPT